MSQSQIDQSLELKNTDNQEEQKIDIEEQIICQQQFIDQ